MKTLITTSALALMIVFAFNAAPSHASEEEQCRWWGDMKKCDKYRPQTAEIDEMKDPDQVENERDVADSGDEGSTSEAGAIEQ